MRGIQRQLASKLQLMRQQLLHLSTTPVTTSDISQAMIHGHRPTQAKILSLGEYVVLSDITFMFTHSFQLSVLILFHCKIHASLFSFSRFLLVCLINLKKNQKNSCSFLVSLLSMPVVVIIKRKHKKISRSCFVCWELSHSFISFLFFGGREEKTTIKMLKWLLYALLLIYPTTHITLSSHLY